MRLVYLRISKGLPNEAAQRAALSAAGLTEDELAAAYVDRPTKAHPELTYREAIVGAARPEDEMWVARPGVLSTTLDDAIDFLARVSRSGAAVCIASTGDRFYCPPEAQEHVADGLRLAAAIYADERRVVLDKARGAVRVRPGKAPTSPAKLRAAKPLWENPDLTAAEAAERSGLGVRTLYRAFGAKGTTRWGKKK